MAATEPATGGNFPSAPEYGRSLTGIGINLLVRNLPRGLEFARLVLEAEVLHSTDKFAALRRGTAHFMLHTDDTFRGNPLFGLVAGSDARGIGIELRVYDLDPDAAEARAREAGFTILAGSMDKPHGLREAMILDDEGYLWVPSRHLPREST